MYCPEDGTHIQPPEEVEMEELTYPPCPSCGAKWVYQGDLSIGPCYILEGWDEEAQVRWDDAQPHNWCCMCDECVIRRRTEGHDKPLSAQIGKHEPNLSSEQPS